MPPISPTAIRVRIDRLLNQRRARFRRALVLLLTRHGRTGATPQELIAAVHDLCVRELAKRVRIVSHELSQGRAARADTPAARLFDGIRAEVTGYLSEETSDLAVDEEIARQLITRLPRRLPRP
ncbi:MAG: hypothetical protein AAB152_04025 [Candidatus Coatesbacteria bacterium]